MLSQSFKYTIISCVVFLCSCNWFEKPPEHQFSQAELLEDFDYLTDKLSELVPSIGLYKDPEQLAEQWRELRESIDSPMTDLSFFPILKEAIAAVEEGHIYLSGWNDEESHVYQRLLRDHSPLMPIQMRVLQDGLYVWQNRSHSDDAPERGAKVIAINGDPADYLVTFLSRKIATDAAITNARLNDLDLIFHVWYYLLFDQPESFTIETLSRDGETETYQFEAVSLQEQNKHRLARYGAPESRPPLSADNFFEQEVWPEQNALYLNLFSYHSSLLLEHEVNPREFWRGIFAQLEAESITNLVIDLRENRGGRNEFVWDLLPFINQNQLSGIFSQARAYDGEDHGTKLVFEIPKYDDSIVFKGKVYALINGNTFSNGSMTAMALKEFANATLIGSETASRYVGFAASSWESFNLPNTNIPVRIPFFVTEYPVADMQTNSNRGVIPDLLVHPEINDLIAEIDVFKESIKKLINDSHQTNQDLK